MAIRAPFNFVPLSNEVFFPDWADQISQDIPFEDGLSGSIDVELTAETPIFVRNGHSKSDAVDKNGNYQSFSRTPDGKYFIPGTSVKGCIRNVLEILSFGKMRVDSNAKFAQREWNDPSLYSIKNPNKQAKIRCGWLCRKDNRYIIKLCKGFPQRIALSHIDNHFKTTVFEEHFSAERSFNITKPTNLNGKEYDPKTAAFKYALLESIGVSRNDLKKLRFSKDEKYSKAGRGVDFNSLGELTGTLVFTGQPDKAKNWGKSRNVNAGKFFEFVFPDEIQKEIDLDESTFKKYKFIYSDSEDWKDWSSELDKGGIPIFLQYENNRLIDFGLALLYRLPYSHSVSDLEQSRRAKDGLDLADCVFGCINDNESIKGRVLFSNFVSHNAELDKQFTLILNSPKASYYPVYIKQQEQPNDCKGIVSKYKTYNDGRLVGWKRYHLRNGVWVKCMDNEKLDTTIYPLKSGSTFYGKVIFHNLKLEELGALLSALTFHNNSNLCRHQIGQAKPYGFGVVSVDVKSVTCSDSDKFTSKEYAMATFERIMSKNLNPAWHNQESIIQLLTLASKKVDANDKNYLYMNLDVDGKSNEFVDNKGGIKGDKTKYYLQKFSNICNYRFPITSMLPSFADILEQKDQQEADRIQAKRIADEQRAKEQLAEIEREKEKAKEQENAKKVSDGLRFLSELKVNGEGYKIDKFKTGFNQIESWLKKANTEKLPTEQLDAFKDFLLRIPFKEEKKDLPKRDSNLWLKIEKLTSKEFADDIFSKRNTQ